MKINRDFTFFIEIVLIFIYIFIIIFSIAIQPFYLILGIICVLFLPGYNLLNLIKPQFNLIEKLGYTIILSLAIENLIMFFSYIFLYNIVTSPEFPGFIFDGILLILVIQFINIILIFIFKYKKIKRNKRPEFFQIKIDLKKKDFKILIIFIVFFLSLILLCISTLFSDVPNNDFDTNYKVYRNNFTFFYRVPPIFYLFLITSILCLTYIIFFIKNKYFILISISAFIYCLWILPYLQIGNYFGSDSNRLAEVCTGYPVYGIKVSTGAMFVVREKDFFNPWRYSTSLFTTILLTSATGVDHDFVLMYLFPLIFIFFPFFFYSIFQKYSNKMVNDDLNLIILTVLAFITPLTVKNAHSATTGIIGIYIFLILVVEFFNWIHRREFKSKIKNLPFIIFLYIFLCLTHMEECVYFLIIIIIYSIYYLFFEINKIEINNVLRIKKFKKNLVMIGCLICTLSIIFYLIQEFYGYLKKMFFIITKSINSTIFFDLYDNSKVQVLFILGNSFEFSLIVIGLIIIGTIIYVIGCYLIYFKLNYLLIKIQNIIIKILKSYHNILNKLISTKLFQYLLIPVIFGVILLLNTLFIQFLVEQGLLLIIELILSYIIFIFHIFLFFMGIVYYKIGNHKQNYFLITIIASSSIMLILFISGNYTLGFYVLNARFFTPFIFFNLIIIQNTFFDKFIKKRKIYLILLMILLLFVGTFCSLRKLAYG